MSTATVYTAADFTPAGPELSDGDVTLNELTPEQIVRDAYLALARAVATY